jgi:hypothetical protein
MTKTQFDSGYPDMNVRDRVRLIRGCTINGITFYRSQRGIVVEASKLSTTVLVEFEGYPGKAFRVPKKELMKW